jgi:prepilin-type N-terminal cleavage/methylation domain-containing protein
MKNKISKMKGFTLVELLIVIALIAILSVAVLATINPIEQSNKARDAAQKNDAAEVLSAYERYYTSQTTYPWGIPETVGATVVDSTVPGFGVTGGSGIDGVLVSTSELKSSFAAKTPFSSSVTDVDKMYVYNNGSDANYVCYVPKAKANRSKLGDLRCLTGATMLNPGDSGCASIAADATAWNATYYGSGNATFMCVPETATVVVSGVTPTPTP